jgi:hypothetical protein
VGVLVVVSVVALLVSYITTHSDILYQFSHVQDKSYETDVSFVAVDDRILLT